MPFYVLRISKTRDPCLVLVCGSDLNGDGRARENEYYRLDTARDSDFARIERSEAQNLITDADGRGFGDLPVAPFATLEKISEWLEDNGTPLAPPVETRVVSGENLEAVVQKCINDCTTARTTG